MTHEALGWTRPWKADASETCPPLEGDTRADVCIVGGGYTGLWTAIMLKEQNLELDVLLIEEGIASGAGASGRNGGCALSWSAKYFTSDCSALKRLCDWSI